MREQVIGELSGAFQLSDVDSFGFSLEREGQRVRVLISAEQLAAYIAEIENSAFQAMGIEPAWKSGLSLSAVHIAEEAAMADTGTTVIIDGNIIRREPPADSAPDASNPTAWSVVTPISGAVQEFGSAQPD